MRVRVGSLYEYNAVPIDRDVAIPDGAIVRVINLYGAPPANTMNHCYVAVPDTGRFIAMVCCNSLVPVVPACVKRNRARFYS